jgi:hypothetical protein
LIIVDLPSNARGRARAAKQPAAKIDGLSPASRAQSARTWDPALPPRRLVPHETSVAPPGSRIHYAKDAKVPLGCVRSPVGN